MALCASRRGIVSVAWTAPLTALLAQTSLPGPALSLPLGPPIRVPFGVQEPLQILTSEQVAALQPVLRAVVSRAKAPTMLRLAFHDAATYDIRDKSGGLNGSTQFELERRENAGLKRGWTTVLDAKKRLKGTAAEELSCADLIALLGAQAVQACEGPLIPVTVGRSDATEADPPGRLPDENASIDELKAAFARMGFSVPELVCLSGAHTIGGKGFGDPAKFDNTYFTALLKKPWLNRADSMAAMIGLPSDHILPDDGECATVIEQYAKSTKLFHRDFVNAYVKMTQLGYLA